MCVSFQVYSKKSIIIYFLFLFVFHVMGGWKDTPTINLILSRWHSCEFRQLQSLQEIPEHPIYQIHHQETELLR